MRRLSGKQDSLNKYVPDQIVQPSKYVQAVGLFILGDFHSLFDVFLLGLPQNLWVERRAGSPRQTDSVPVCSPPSRRVAPLRPRCAGLTAWTPAARTSVPALV